MRAPYATRNIDARWILPAADAESGVRDGHRVIDSFLTTKVSVQSLCRATHKLLSVARKSE
jgi:hypothetical protein